MIVLDASALLTFIFDEAGAEEIERLLPSSLMHIVNWAEVLSKLTEHGLDPDEAMQQMDDAGITGLLGIDPGTPEDALDVARLHTITQSVGLSLGDRYCLALARRHGVPAVTANRAWTQLDIGVEVRSLR